MFIIPSTHSSIIIRGLLPFSSSWKCNYRVCITISILHVTSTNAYTRISCLVQLGQRNYNANIYFFLSQSDWNFSDQFANIEHDKKLKHIRANFFLLAIFFKQWKNYIFSFCFWDRIRFLLFCSKNIIKIVLEIFLECFCLSWKKIWKI